jgi:hypothetical protein
MDNESYVDCPVPTCPGIYSKRYSLRLHFQHRHWMDDIIIDEEGPLRKCQLCYLTCSYPLSRRHLNSKPCRDGIMRHNRRLQQQQSELAEAATLQINGTDLEQVQTFKYLGRPLSATSNDQVATNYNLQKAKKAWGRISNILRREGAEPKTMGHFYCAVVQSVLLYGSETWQITNDALTPLISFHHKVARQITNNHIQKLNNTEIWVYPNMPAVLDECGLHPLQTYINKRQTTLLHWAQNRDLFHTARNLEATSPVNKTFWGATTIPD